jgi:hypothetical protein
MTWESTKFSKMDTNNAYLGKCKKIKKYLHAKKSSLTFNTLNFCMRTHNNFCSNRPFPAAQALSTPGSQLVKAEGFMSKNGFVYILCV